MRHLGRRLSTLGDNLIGMGLEIAASLLIMLIALALAVVATGGRF